MKVVYLARRRPGVDHDALVRFWREVNVADVAAALRPDRYVVTFFQPHPKRPEHSWDGMAVVWACLAVTLSAMLLSILLQVLNRTVGAGEASSLVGTVQGQIRNSRLVPVFLDLTPLFTKIIEPWFPNGMPAILR